MTDDSTNPQNPPEDAVIPPAPPETPIPEGLISAEPVIPPPPADIPVADAVIPPPPPEAMLPSRGARRKPAILTDDQPSAVAPDWSQPSVAPEVPTSGSYRALTFVIFALLAVVLIAAVVLGIVLATTSPFPFAAGGVVLSL